MRALPSLVRGALRRLRRWGRHALVAARPVSALAPEVVVLGKEKSGTTAIAALLAERTGRSATLDVPSLWGEQEVALYRGTASFEAYLRQNKLPFSRDVVKEPGLTCLYPAVRRHFPSARVVMIVRDPRDNIRSVFNRLNLPGDRATLDAETFDALPDVWKIVVDSRWLGLDADDYVEMAARRWCHLADVYLDHADAMTLVRFEDFLDDKVGCIDALADRLDLPRVHDIHDKVDVQYQPRGNRSVTWSDFFGETNLRRIESVCRTRMTALGYAPSVVEPTSNCS